VKTVILAGGYGTRLSEETGIKPKPMVEIGEMPLLWHIMKIYSAQGFHDFVICLGYKGYVIKEFFANYSLRTSDVTIELDTGHLHFHRRRAEPWRVTLVDTGEGTMTGGRLKRAAPYIGNETFFLTYGDGVSDVNLHRLLEFHRAQGAWVTLTAVQPPGRFGAFNLSEGQTLIHHFREKTRGDGAWINGGFFVVEPRALEYIEGDHTVWEAEPLSRLAHDGRLAAYRHQGFWQNMDTLRDKMVLEEMWKQGAPWKLWD
jgi:glucose-1-phosphate cytidylyltransferase